MTRLVPPIFDHPRLTFFWSALILESHHQTGHTNFWPCSFFTMTTPIFVWNCTRMQKISSISSFLRYSKFYSSETRLATLIFDHAPPKTFQSTFNFCEFVSTYKKWSRFINLLWRNAWFKYPAISVAEIILACISGITLFPNRRFSQGTQ